MMKFFRIEKKTVGMSLAGEMAYKTNFYIKAFAMVLADFVGPLLTLLIYSTTLGIPGWSLNEFLLFQGTLILVFGLGHTFTMHFPYEVIHCIREGEFDKYLVKPYNTMLYILSESFIIDGLPEVAVGICLVAYTMVKLGLSVFSFSFFWYLVLVAAGLLVQVAVMVFISAFAFLVVRSEALMNLYFKLSDFIRYPLNVYALGIQFAFTFLFPLAVSSFYPAEVLLRGATPKILLSVLIPVILFTAVSVFLWNLAMKKYTSAGG
ncbi:ABC-2 family transporter protein [Candidatus Woesearchaeota archaeon]|nr:ABC-2 family transporter protein [Candidatus Woesearchaeota archaeon]